jgi:hypothetical protein
MPKFSPETMINELPEPGVFGHANESTEAS